VFVAVVIPALAVIVPPDPTFSSGKLVASEVVFPVIVIRPTEEKTGAVHSDKSIIFFPATAVVAALIAVVPVTSTCADVPVASQTIWPTPVLVGTPLITRLPPTFKSAVPLRVIVWLLAVVLALKVRAPVIVVVVPVERAKLFAAVGLEIVRAPIVRVPADLSFERALFVGIVIVPPKFILLEPAKESAPVPVIVTLPVPVLNVVPL
jgi:hypothetical protein